MNKQLRKNLKRAVEVISYGSSQLLPRGFTIITSSLIINFHSLNFWGDYVEILLVVNIASILMGYGSFQHLLKAFSESPSTATQLWTKCLFTRMLILGPIGLILAVLPLGVTLKLCILFWIIISFVNQSFHVLIVFNKKFKTSFYAEVIAGLSLVLFVAYLGKSITLTLFILLINFSFFLKMILYLMHFRTQFSTRYISIDLTYFKDAFSFAFLSLIGTLRVQTDTYIVALFLDNGSLGKYHILITILMLIESFASYLFNPSAKLLYRISNRTLAIFKKNALIIGLPFALIALIASFLILSLYTSVSVPIWFYMAVMLFAIPQLYKMTILNELFKRNAQQSIALIAVTFFCIQAIIGYIFIPSGGIQTAIVLRVGSFLIHLQVLHFFSRKTIISI